MRTRQKSRHDALYHSGQGAPKVATRSPLQRAALENAFRSSRTSGSIKRLASSGRRFYRFHVSVRQPKMMADFVHQHMRDNCAERFVVLGPVIENRAAI